MKYLFIFLAISLSSCSITEPVDGYCNYDIFNGYEEECK